MDLTKTTMSRVGAAVDDSPAQSASLGCLWRTIERDSCGKRRNHAERGCQEARRACAIKVDWDMFVIFRAAKTYPFQPPVAETNRW